MCIKFEYETPGMPQEHGRVQCKFALLYNKECDMLNGDRFSCFIGDGLWTEAANIAMQLETNLTTRS